MNNDQSITLVIREHDFQQAKNALKKYSERTRTSVNLPQVPTAGKYISFFDHKVTGDELNDVVSKIQDGFIAFNRFNQDIVTELGNVYKAFEGLDKDYIAGIVTSIKATEKVNGKILKEQKRIDNLVVQQNELIKQHDKTIDVLVKFNEDIKKLKHFTDIDTAWELLEAQIDLSKELSDYRDSLSELHHLKDVDILWDNTQSAIRDIQNINAALEQQDKVIAQFHETLKRMQEAQKQFINTVNQMTDSFREDFNNQMQRLEEEQTARLNAIDSKYAATMDNLSTAQKETFASMKNTLTSSLEAAVKEQTLSIQNIKNEQEEQFNQLAENQSTTLGQIADDQKGKLAEISNSLEEETVALNEQVNTLTQRVKNLSFVAGGAAVLAIIQLLFNVFGRM